MFSISFVACLFYSPSLGRSAVLALSQRWVITHLSNGVASVCSLTPTWICTGVSDVILIALTTARSDLHTSIFVRSCVLPGSKGGSLKAAIEGCAPKAIAAAANAAAALLAFPGFCLSSCCCASAALQIIIQDATEFGLDQTSLPSKL